jgi:hypothetical protein
MNAQRVADGLLDWLFVKPVELEIFDNGADHDTAPHELTDHVADVFVVAPKPVNPADNEHVASPKFVE